MKTNRLLPHQFAPGNTADGTRIEQALGELVSLYNDVPPSLVKRRWSPSHMVWGLQPSRAPTGCTYQWMSKMNDSSAASSMQPPTAYRNPQRVKSTEARPVYVTTGTQIDDVLTMELTFATTGPVVIGATGLFAEVQPGASGIYDNEWLFGAVPPPDKNIGDPSDDFTLQVCVADGWDLENRRKLRQEVLVYNTRSDAFKFSPVSTAGLPDPLVPAHPVSVFDGFAITPCPLVLVPGGSRVLFQWSIPKYDPTTGATWGAYPAQNNVWSMGAQIWRPTL